MNPEQASAIHQFLIPQIEPEWQLTRRVMAAVPEDKSAYKPSENCKSAIELVRHIASADIWFLESVVNGEFAHPDDSTTKDKNVADMLAVYDKQMPMLIEKLKALTPEQLAKPTKFFIFEYPLVTYLQFMLKHSAHHRGQLSAYLRPMGAKVPSIYGGSYDEPMTASSEANA
jgi:uncharacterized damage-inducible protein DinB